VEMYPSTSFVVACNCWFQEASMSCLIRLFLTHDLLLLHGKWEGLEMWLLSLENACVEAVLIGHM
jgi:hypothetical protein